MIEFVVVALGFGLYKLGYWIRGVIERGKTENDRLVDDLFTAIDRRNERLERGVLSPMDPETAALCQRAVEATERRKREEVENPELVDERMERTAAWVIDPGNDLFRDAGEIHKARPPHPIGGCRAEGGHMGEEWTFCPFCSGRLPAPSRTSPPESEHESKQAAPCEDSASEQAKPCNTTETP